MSAALASTFYPATRSDGAGSTVLVVEDFDDSRFILKVMLELRGYRVVEASDGLQAIEVARRERPDLVLMDLNLPLLDGFAATRRIRELDGLRDVPVVALTAHVTPDYRSKAVAAGCDELISKPINIARLEETLRRLTSADKELAA